MGQFSQQYNKIYELHTKPNVLVENVNNLRQNKTNRQINGDLCILLNSFLITTEKREKKEEEKHKCARRVSFGKGASRHSWPVLNRDLGAFFLSFFIWRDRLFLPIILSICARTYLLHTYIARGSNRIQTADSNKHIFFFSFFRDVFCWNRPNERAQQGKAKRET